MSDIDIIIFVFVSNVLFLLSLFLSFCYLSSTAKQFTVEVNDGELFILNNKGKKLFGASLSDYQWFKGNSSWRIGSDTFHCFYPAQSNVILLERVSCDTHSGTVLPTVLAVGYKNKEQWQTILDNYNVKKKTDEMTLSPISEYGLAYWICLSLLLSITTSYTFSLLFDKILDAMNSALDTKLGVTWALFIGSIFPLFVILTDYPPFVLRIHPAEKAGFYRNRTTKFFLCLKCVFVYALPVISSFFMIGKGQWTVTSFVVCCPIYIITCFLFCLYLYYLRGKAGLTQSGS